MLVQTGFSEVVEGMSFGNSVLLCSKCKKEIGPVTLDELQGMMSGKYGDAICFECEDWPPQPFGSLKPGVRKNLLGLFGFDDVVELPLHANNGWTNDREDVTLQMSKNFGWCFWLSSPDGKWQLRKVGMSLDEANALKAAYCMLPCRLR